MPDTVQTLKFQDDVEIRQAFREYENGVGIPTARRATLIAGAFVFGGTLMDWQVFPALGWQFLLIRSVCTLVLVFIYAALGTWPRTRRLNLISYGIAVPPIISICMMIVATGGAESSYYAGLNLVLVGLSMLWRWSFWNSLVIVLICQGCYVLSVWLAPGDIVLPHLVNNGWFLLVTSVFVVAGNFFYERLRFQEFSLRVEVERSRELLETQNRKLSELDEAKTSFFANISHELRTPLTIMLGVTEKLRREVGLVGAGPGEEMVEILEQNGLRLLKLIDDLLDLVRFDSGGADVKAQPTDPRPLIDGLVRSLRHLADENRVLLTCVAKVDVPQVMLDRDKIEKIVFNLVMNAIKFTPSGGSVEVRLVVEEGIMTLEVADTGVGIEKHMLDKVFERFWQVDTSATRKFQGAGLGLALVRSLTEAMSGTIKVDSRVGRGTTFVIRMPVEVVVGGVDGALLDDGNPVPAGEQENVVSRLHRKAAFAPARTGSGGFGSPGMAPRMALPGASGRPVVLVADDEPDMRRFLKMQFTDTDVVEAADGLEALELAKQHLPRLILLDHMMPEMDGVEVCRRLREHSTTRETPIIVLTARADDRTKLEALRAGASDFLTKPFSSAELALRIDNQMAMARFRRELAEANRELKSALDQLKESEVLLVRNEKLSALGRMSAGIIHEINNPLNYSQAGIHALESFGRQLPEGGRSEYAEVLGDVREGVERVSQIVSDLRQFTRDSGANDEDVAIRDVVDRAARLFGHEFGNDIRLENAVSDEVVVDGSRNQLVQVFVNFLQNSIDAIRERMRSDGGAPGLIEVRAAATVAGGWDVVVRDNGSGIPAEMMPKIFDPFFTSKDVGKGMGLGLSITHRILERHRAVIDVDSHPGRTEFRLSFPRRQQAATVSPDEVSLPA